MAHKLATHFPAGDITEDPCNKSLFSVYKLIGTARSKMFKVLPREAQFSLLNRYHTAISCLK